MLGQTDAQCSEMDKKTLKFNEKLLVKCIVHGFKNDPVCGTGDQIWSKWQLWNVKKNSVASHVFISVAQHQLQHVE